MKYQSPQISHIASPNRNSNHKIYLHNLPFKFYAILALIAPHMHFNAIPFIIIIS